MTQAAEKTLILIRHAHRDTSDRDQDNGLSEKGHEQAKEIGKHYVQFWVEKKRLDAEMPLILSSAKTRCVQTLEPLAEKLGVKIIIHDGLMEQTLKETEAQFLKRIAHFIEEWKTQLPPLTIICSHGDWLPTAIDLMTGQFVDTKKGSWTQIDLVNGDPRFIELIQKF